jgi:hypothetical protein
MIQEQIFFLVFAIKPLRGVDTYVSPHIRKLDTRWREASIPGGITSCKMTPEPNASGCFWEEITIFTMMGISPRHFSWPAHTLNNIFVLIPRLKKVGLLKVVHVIGNWMINTREETERKTRRTDKWRNALVYDDSIHGMWLAELIQRSKNRLL